MIGGNFKTIDFGNLVYKMPYGSFFLVEPIDLNEVKAKDTFNKNPKKFRKYQLPKRRHYCIKKNLLVENVAKISARHAPNLLRVTLCFFPCEVLNKHGFFLVKDLYQLNIVSSFSPREMGKSKLCIRG